MAGNWPWAQVKVQTAEPLGYDGIKIPYWLHRQANTQWSPSKLHSGLIGKVSTTTLHIGFWSTRTSESWCEQNSDTPSCFLPTKGSSSLNPSNNKWFCTKPSFSEPHILSEISESWHRNLCLYQGVSGDFWNYDFLVCHPAFCCTSRTSFALTRVFLLAKLRFTRATLLCQFGAKHSTLKSFTVLVEPRIAVCEFLWRLRPNLTIHPVESRTCRTSEYDNERGS